MKNEVILNKISTIERCIKRIQEVYGNNPDNLEDYTKQDSIILNIQRACKASIDLAMHIVAGKKLGLPQSSRDAFDLLVAADLLSAELANKLKAMVGFRNIAVHDYQSVNLDIVRQIIEKYLKDFKLFTKEVMGILDL
ncbi:MULTISPECIES: type VII toxin-antitoxin system HepT family RNase toxin [Bacillus cereus group]|uniref:DUF86 domain-containing protein n=2 Tax=Bacillus cereus group TaxID=86661 RepID=A0A2C1E5E0_BACCE|nr:MULTISPECIES: DUF86 domain-containing protein [Bacillus cereus group]OFD75905.1 hypothetical protein BWGOE8_34460 [Bacillus mycoides]OFD79296.1 hypothetical protein BWGOE9_25030 [Bacillus mycoides]OFD82346.1 hypothetical protein BWGOE10_22980 [Bacillus mycoides]PGT07359.1 DUF86 domain-containing protein [Bacillus cereus]